MGQVQVSEQHYAPKPIIRLLSLLADALSARQKEVFRHPHGGIMYKPKIFKSDSSPLLMLCEFDIEDYFW